MWRLYARLHQRLIDYSYQLCAGSNPHRHAHSSAALLVEPKSSAAWTNWWTYLYGRDLLVSPIWEKGKRTQQVYLPSGSKWRDAWSGKLFDGGQTITVNAELHQIPLFVRVGAKVKLGDPQSGVERIARDC